MSFRRFLQRLRARLHPVPRARAPRRRPRLERLEDRTLPAFLGPDAFGYYANTSAAFSYEDISATGTRVLAGTDDSTVSAALPFAFNFYGTSYSTVFISTNGLLTFGSGNTTFTNTDLKLAGNQPPQPAIAPLWDDWSATPSGTDAVYYQTLGAPGNERFVVQWHNLDHFPSSPGRVDFEAVLFQNGDIEFRYNQVNTGDANANGASATVGIRNAEPPAVANGQVLEVSFNAANIHNGEAILFDQPPYDITVNASADPNGNGPNNGTPDTFAVRRSGTNNVDLTITVNGTDVLTVPYASVHSVTINGSNDNDTLTINGANGNPVPTGGLSFDGSGGTNSLLLEGGSFTNEVITPTGPHAGTISLDGNVITFANLTKPITDTSTAANLSFNDPAAGEQINVVDGPIVTTPDLPSGGQTTEVNSGAAGTFEAVDFADKTSVTVNGQGANDTLTLNNPHPAVGLTNLAVDGSGSNDTLTVGTATTLPGNIALTAATINLNNPVTSTNGNLALTATNSLTLGQLLSAAKGTVTLTSTAGSLLSGGTANEVAASGLALVAATGIGTPSAPLETAVSNLEAETATGGIFISNTGNLTIGGVTAALHGVHVTTSGPIVLSASGSVAVNLAGETVAGPGDVTIQANGGMANILTGGGNTGTGAAVASTGGTVTLKAGQDILIGDVPGNAAGDVSGGGSVVLNAGRDVIVDAQSAVRAHGTGTVMATAQRNLSLLHSAGGTQPAQITTEGGTITLTTGAGGIFTDDAGGSGNGLDTTQKGAAGGDITISADSMVLNTPINAGTGTVTLRQATTSVQPIDLGGAGSGTRLSLTSAGLDLITAGILRIGRLDNTSPITITAPINALNHFGTLSLLTGGAILDTNATKPDLTVNSLALQATGGIASAAAPLATQVMNLAFNNTGGVVNISNTGGLTVGPVDTLLTSANTGTTTLAASGPLTFAANTSSGGPATFTAAGGPANNNLTVDSGVTLFTTGAGANIVLQAGDMVTEQAGATIRAAGTLSITGGFNESDTDGGATLDGVVAGTTVNVMGGAGNDTFNINLAAGSSPQVTIDGMAGSDTFHITPSATTAFTVHGGPPPPPASPGDTLDVDLTGTTNPMLSVTSTPTGFQGMWTFGNAQPITFDTIETIANAASLAVTLTPSAPSANEGDTLTFSFTVHNIGPNDAANVVLTDQLGGLTFQSATVSQGIFNAANGTVTFAIGTVAAGATVTGTVTVAAGEDGSFTNTATVTTSSPNVGPGVMQSVTVTIGEPPIVGSAAPLPTVFEGQAPAAGTVLATFTHVHGLEPAGDFSAVIDWGDGTTSAGFVVQSGTTYQVLGAHAFGDEGTFTITVHITDDRGSATFTTLASVLEALLPPGSPHGPLGTANERFLAELYQDLFGLPISVPALLRYGRRLDRGVSGRQVALELLKQPGLRRLFYQRQIVALYTTFRGGPPSAGQLAAALRLVTRSGLPRFITLFLRVPLGEADVKLGNLYAAEFLEPAGDPNLAGTLVQAMLMGLNDTAAAAFTVGLPVFFAKTAP
jgi:uncharacterized repeat protein (TIGR01451 family)